MLKGCLSKNFWRSGPHQTLQANWRNSKRRIVRVTEQLRAHVRFNMLRKVLRDQFNFTNVGCVAMQVDVFVATPVEVLECKTRDALACTFSQIVDARKLRVVVKCH